MTSETPDTRPLPMTKRVRIPTGLDCNEHCRFCYYYDELNTKRYTTDQMRDKLKYAKEHNIRDIDFSGGEPTLRKDLLMLISEAKGMGFAKICIITNGSRLKDRPYIEDLARSGLNEILLSIHGHDASSHNEAVGRDDAWGYVQEAVKYIHSLGIRLRTNTVVTKLNYNTLTRIARYLTSIHPVAANFICFNDWNRAADLTKDLACRYSQANQPLWQAIDILAPAVSKVTVRYIPFCFMPGYEQHVCGILQNEFDPDEWIDPIKKVLTFNEVDGDEADSYYKDLYMYFKDNQEEALRGIESGFVHGELKDPRIFHDLPERFIRLAHKAHNARVRRNYIKSDECQHCCLNKICDGLENTYARFIGTGELKRVTGKILEDPMIFRRGYSYTWK